MEFVYSYAKEYGSKKFNKRNKKMKRKKVKVNAKAKLHAKMKTTKRKIMERPFDLVIVGYGGQGILSLAEIIANAAFMQGFDVKQTEMHGLAQRFGALQCCVRFGKKVYSPLVRKGNANLIIALDALEAARAVLVLNFSSKNKSVVLTDSFALHPGPMEETLEIKTLISEMKKNVKSVKVVDASKITERLVGETSMSNIFMLGYALKNKLLPLKKEIVWKAITQRLRPEFLEKNKKVFAEAFKL